LAGTHRRLADVDDARNAVERRPYSGSLRRIRDDNHWCPGTGWEVPRRHLLTDHRVRVTAERLLVGETARVQVDEADGEDTEHQCGDGPDPTRVPTDPLPGARPESGRRRLGRTEGRPARP